MTPLSKTEWEIALLLADGKKNREIAEAWGRSLATINKHVQHIFEKTGFHSRLRVAIWVKTEGIPLGQRLNVLRDERTLGQKLGING